MPNIPTQDQIRKAEEICALYAYIRGNHMIELTNDRDAGDFGGMYTQDAVIAACERDRADSNERDRMALDLATNIVLGGRKWRG